MKCWCSISHFLGVIIELVQTGPEVIAIAQRISKISSKWTNIFSYIFSLFRLNVLYKVVSIFTCLLIAVMVQK